MITVQFKLIPTVEQESFLRQTTNEYISCANKLINHCCGQIEIPKLSSASFCAALPSAVKNEVINVVRSIMRKYERGKCGTLPILRKPVCTWNNQNYRLLENAVVFPVLIGGNSKRISVSAVITDYQRDKLSGKLGTLRITQKNGKWIAQVAVEPALVEQPGNTTMGVDLGLKVPAVAVTDTGKTKFSGNGRMNKYKKRKYRAHRKALGKAKKQKAINRINNKEQRWMKDQDHKISREIVNFAIERDVGTIRMEQLQNIRQTARTSRKNEKNLHTWSFYRLSGYIDYKARMAGIAVEYVNPAYTSQTCPGGGSLNRANDRLYRCSCGFRTHRDRLGAMNIITAPVVAGNRQLA
jgi:IS605 OrfB family transposase